jgi:hypothetical protein
MESWEAQGQGSILAVGLVTSRSHEARSDILVVEGGVSRGSGGFNGTGLGLGSWGMERRLTLEEESVCLSLSTFEHGGNGPSQPQSSPYVRDQTRIKKKKGRV